MHTMQLFTEWPHAGCERYWGTAGRWKMQRLADRGWNGRPCLYRADKFAIWLNAAPFGLPKVEVEVAKADFGDR